MGVSGLPHLQEVSSGMFFFFFFSRHSTQKTETVGWPGDQTDTPLNLEMHQVLEGASDESLRDSLSSGGKIRAQARFLRHPKSRKDLRSGSVHSYFCQKEFKT